MKRLSEFDIELVRLKPGKHEFNYQLGSSFFEAFEYGIVNKGDLKVKVILDKSHALLKFDIDIEGTIELTCDRSLENFDYPLSIHDHVMMKFGEEEGELSENVFVIKPDKQVINLSDFLYEYITVAVPIKRLHPKFAGEEEAEQDQLVYTSLTEEEIEKEKQEKEEDIDPRWKELLKLKNNKK